MLLDLEQLLLTSKTSFTLEKLFLKRVEWDFRVTSSPASEKIAMSLRATSEILNKMNNFFKSLKYYLRM